MQNVHKWQLIMLLPVRIQGSRQVNLDCLVQRVLEGNLVGDGVVGADRDDRLGMQAVLEQLNVARVLNLGNNGPTSQVLAGSNLKLLFIM